MEKEEVKQEEVKSRKHKGNNIVIKVMAIFIALTMILATCSTFIFYMLTMNK